MILNANALELLQSCTKPLILCYTEFQNVMGLHLSSHMWWYNIEPVFRNLITDHHNEPADVKKSYPISLMVSLNWAEELASIKLSEQTWVGDLKAQ